MLIYHLYYNFDVIDKINKYVYLSIFFISYFCFFHYIIFLFLYFLFCCPWACCPPEASEPAVTGVSAAVEGLYGAGLGASGLPGGRTPHDRRRADRARQPVLRRENDAATRRRYRCGRYRCAVLGAQARDSDGDEPSLSWRPKRPARSTQLATLAPSIMARRSASASPPHTPNGSRVRNANSRHGAMTGQPWQTALAAAVRRALEGFRSPSGWKNIALSMPRHDPSRCHCHSCSDGPGRREMSLTSSPRFLGDCAQRNDVIPN